MFTHLNSFVSCLYISPFFVIFLPFLHGYPKNGISSGKRVSNFVANTIRKCFKIKPSIQKVVFSPKTSIL